MFAWKFISERTEDSTMLVFNLSLDKLKFVVSLFPHSTHQSFELSKAYRQFVSHEVLNIKQTNSCQESDFLPVRQTRIQA